MHSRAVVAEALRLREEEGLRAVQVARRLGLRVGTVRDWFAGKLPHSYLGPAAGCCQACGQPRHQFSRLSREYVYLLGLYLGDGTISSHRRGVYRLRIFLDRKYPEIVAECESAMAAVMPANRPERLLTPSNCFQVSSYSRAWPCLFPQHGPGRKHDRRIWLAEWQQELAERWPEALLRGMIHSDGSRFANTNRDGWSQPRYCFTNMSSDLTSIYCTACDKLGLRWTAAFPEDERKAVRIYVSRKADVARMDEFIGPKR